MSKAKSSRYWQCPSCDHTYASPIPILEYAHKCNKGQVGRTVCKPTTKAIAAPDTEKGAEVHQ